MSTRQMKKRVATIQEKVCPEHDDSYTLEELCRMWWRLDKQGFIEHAHESGSMCRSLVDQFEREDAERAARLLSCDGSAA